MNVIDVATGEIKFTDKEHILASHAIGSCIVVTVYDPQKQSGAMAHIMLPGKAPATKTHDKFKYAHDAINEIMNTMDDGSGRSDHLQVCLVGGGNVLRKTDDSICRHNINSVKQIIKSKNIAVKAESLGGEQRRTMKLIVESGKVFFSVGGAAEKILFDPQAE